MTDRAAAEVRAFGLSNPATLTALVAYVLLVPMPLVVAIFAWIGAAVLATLTVADATLIALQRRQDRLWVAMAEDELDRTDPVDLSRVEKARRQLEVPAFRFCWDKTSREYSESLGDRLGIIGMLLLLCLFCVPFIHMPLWLSVIICGFLLTEGIGALGAGVEQLRAPPDRHR